MSKPIRVFFSPVTSRFYASRVYRIDAKGMAILTGDKFDVSNDIGDAILKYQLKFNKEG